ncbi:MAG: CapA family protein [Clostridia bacterium]
MKKILIPILCMVLMFTGCNKATTEKEIETPAGGEPNSSSSKTLPKNTTTASIAFFGDLLMHDTIFKSAKISKGYDFDSQFTDIGKILSKYDFRVGNLETTFAGTKDYDYSGYPQFNCPEDFTKTIKNTLKVDLLSTANNHAVDTFFKGISNTIDVLDEANIAHTGTYKTLEDSQKPCIFTVNDIKIGFLNYTYGVNVPLKDDKPFSVNIIEKQDIANKAKALKNSGAEFIFFNPHWGIEYDMYPSEVQKELAKWLFENTDINAIVGHHPHVAQPIEEVIVNRNGEEKKGIVAYSLGNFIGDQNAMQTSYTKSSGEKTDIFTNSGLIASFTIEKSNKTGIPEIKSVNYTPTYIDKNNGDSGKTYRILSVNTAISDYLAGTDRKVSKEDYDKLLKIKTRYEKMIKSTELISQTTY